MKLSLVAVILAISLPAVAQSWDVNKIAARPNRSAEERFGSQVEISGLDAFVTSPSDTDDENESPGGTKGSIYVYAKASSDAPWSFIQKLKSPHSNLAFGVSLSANANYLVVGATSSTKGAAYVYQKNSVGQWDLVQTLENLNGNDNDQYGHRVSISGNTILVTAYGLSPSASLSYSGAAYVYEKNPNDVWVEKQILTASDAATGDILGYAAALNDNIIVLGAPGEGIDNTSGSPNRGHGAVYVYRKQSGTWIETDKIIQEVRIPFASFGEGIGMSENSIVVSAKTKDLAGKLTANFYEIDATPVFKGELLTDFPTGYSACIDMSENLAVFSLPSDGVLKAYLFERDTPTSDWHFGPTIYSPNFNKEFERKFETFGGSISISGTDVLVGAPTNDADGGPDVVSNSGVAYFLKYTGKPPAFTKTFYPELVGDFFNPVLVDFDNDGDLDLFGNSDLDQVQARLFRKDPSGFTEVRTFPPASVSGTAVWLDANGDGWLDLFSRHLVGYPFTIYDNTLYVNQRDGTFTERVIKFPGNDGSYGNLYFADYDIDGDQDILMQVDTYDNSYMQLFRNKGDFTFVDSKITFKGEGHVQSSQPWFDFNNDGFPDFVTIGSFCSNTVNLHINNEGRSFTTHLTEASAMDGTQYGATIWGNMIPADYDNDGDDDFIWTGQRSCQSPLMYTGVIANNDGSLKDSSIKFRGSSGWATMIAGDFSNDGITDMITIGQRTETPPGLDFLIGTGTDFEKFELYEVPWDLFKQGMDVGDVDNDGDLDFFVFARAYPLDEKPMIYINNAAQGWTKKNEAPTAPGKPEVVYGDDHTTLSWSKATDDETPTNALTYNVSITKGDSVILNTYSNVDGSRQRFVPGNAGHRTFLYLRNLQTGAYKVRVQAIDNSFAGSQFSEELKFVLGGETPVDENPVDEDPDDEDPEDEDPDETPDEVTGLENTSFEGLKIYPVPSHDELFIENENSDEFSVSIVDAFGRERNSATLTNKLERLNLTDLAPGLYSIRIEKNGSTVVKRFVKL